MSGMTATEAVVSRRSVRAFLDRPVPLETLKRVMDKARWAPSGCNFQPWEATVLSGAPLKALQAKMLNSAKQEPEEYAVTPAEITARYLARLQEVGARMYADRGVARDDPEARKEAMVRNFLSFGAPVLLLSYFPRFMGPPQWSDIGMWMQTVMLLLREEGLDSCPQEYLSFHARVIKEHIGVSDEDYVFFCGVAIGYRDPDAPINSFDRPRVPLEEQVHFVGF
jgi:nitroreductase